MNRESRFAFSSPLVKLGQLYCIESKKCFGIHSIGPVYWPISLELAVMFAIKVARGAALTGCAASLVALVFAVSHAGDRDPWQFPSAYISILTWFASFVLIAWHRGQSHGSPQPSLFQPLDGIRTAAKEAIGVVLAMAILFTLNAPFIRWGYENAEYRAKKKAQNQLNKSKDDIDRQVEKKGYSSEMQEEVPKTNQKSASPR